MMNTIIVMRDWLVRVVKRVFLSSQSGGLSLQAEPIPPSIPSSLQKKFSRL
ncbi:hypothetical protein ACFLRW_07010 [Acidobacteriota bacterium]